jgi:hypothetical protein
MEEAVDWMWTTEGSDLILDGFRRAHIDDIFLRSFQV